LSEHFDVYKSKFEPVLSKLLNLIQIKIIGLENMGTMMTENIVIKINQLQFYNFVKMSKYNK